MRISIPIRSERSSWTKGQLERPNTSGVKGLELLRLIILKLVFRHVTISGFEKIRILIINFDNDQLDHLLDSLTISYVKLNCYMINNLFFWINKQFSLSITSMIILIKLSFWLLSDSLFSHEYPQMYDMMEIKAIKFNRKPSVAKKKQKLFE